MKNEHGLRLHFDKSKSQATRSSLQLWMNSVKYVVCFSSLHLVFLFPGVLNEVQQFYKIDYSQAGLLQTSFIISYMLLSPLFGYLGDRYNRKYIMAGGIFFWSVVTLAGSFIDEHVCTIYLSNFI